MVLRKLDSYMQKNETWPLSHTIQKKNSKWMKGSNVRQESIKILQENLGSNLFDMGHSNFFQDTSPKARKMKEKWTFGTSSRQEASARQGKQSTKLRSNPWNQRRYLQMTLQIKGWYPRSIKNFSNSTPKKQIIKLKKMEWRHEQIFLQRRHING